MTPPCTKAGLTQEKLAELAQLSTSHIGKIETAETKLSLPCIITLAGVLHTSVDALLADQLPDTRIHLLRDFEQLFDGCTSDELRIMADTMQALKNGLLRARKRTEAMSDK